MKDDLHICSRNETTIMLKSSCSILIFLLLLVSCQTSNSDTVLEDVKKPIQKIDSLLKAQNAKDLFHGQLVLSHHNEVVYENSLGVADRNWRISIEKDTRFDIASVNKSMIAALVMKAVEDGLLNLDDLLIDLLKDFSYQGQFHSEITLHHLLSHSSGLPDYDAVSDDLKRKNFQKFKRLHFSNEEYVDFISRLKPINDPDKQFYYSNFSYHLIAIILENTFGKSFPSILKEHLTDPLGLKNTFSISTNRTIASKLAEGYTYDQKTEQWLKNPFIDLSLGRRIFSTAADLNRWAQVMDNPGYLSAASLKLMQLNHLSHLGEDISYGYGWVVFDKDTKSFMGDIGIDKPYIIHGGRTDGYKAMLININRGEYVLSMLSNTGNRTNELELTKKIIHILIKEQ